MARVTSSAELVKQPEFDTKFSSCLDTKLDRGKNPPRFAVQLHSHLKLSKSARSKREHELESSRLILFLFVSKQKGKKKLLVTSATLVVTSATLVVTSASLLVTSALLVVTRFATRNKLLGLASRTERSDARTRTGGPAFDPVIRPVRPAFRARKEAGLKGRSRQRKATFCKGAQLGWLRGRRGSPCAIRSK